MNKTAIKNFAIWARNKLIADITYKAGLLGITEKEIKNPLPQSTKEVQFFDIGTKEPYSISGEEIKQRDKLVELISSKAYQADYSTAYKSVVEEVAYTWFNRLIAIRFMEINDYLPSRIRVLSSESANKSEPDLVTNPFDTDLEFTPYEKDRIAQLKHDNQLDKLFRILFIMQCNALNAILPALFEKTSDYTELLLNVAFTDKDGVVFHLVNDIQEDDFNVSKEGQVEIIGWMYQYYNTEPKDEVFALLKKNVKITKERIPAATQLFTPDWIVRYMVENSLGRFWLEGHPNEDLKGQWKYYLDEAEQEAEVQRQLDAIRQEYKAIKLEDIKIIDPCMGSGHILVYAFDVLMQIYESQGYSQRDAAKSIVEHNIYGLDIDNRAYQLAYFAVLMKARQYNRRILSKDTNCHVYAIRESNDINREHLKYFGVKMTDIERDSAFKQMQYLLDTFINAKEYGSILNVDDCDWRLLHLFTGNADFREQISIDSVGIEKTQNQIRQLLYIAATMAQKYEAVVTNPPYMGSSGMGNELSDFVKTQYPDTKSDMSTIFMEKSLQMCQQSGYMAMINIPVWMFLSSYEKLRTIILAQNTFANMVHLGRGVFGSDFGTTSFVICKARTKKYLSTYCRLFEKQGAVDNVEQKETWFIEEKGRYVVKQENFSKIPGAPIAYWVSNKILEAFLGNKLKNVINPKQGTSTGNDEIFIRYWPEINFTLMSSKIKSVEEALGSEFVYFPIDKGGAYRKWYGNNEKVIKMDKDSYELLIQMGNHLPSRNLYFKKGLTWSKITSGKFSIRYDDFGFVFSSVGLKGFPEDDQIFYVLGYMNSNVCEYLISIISPGLSTVSGDIEKIPMIIDETVKNIIDKLVKDNIDITKADWDSFETSWDYKYNPLIDISRRNSCSIEEAFKSWDRFMSDQFLQLESNEEEINRLFIEIYGLQDELIPNIEKKDVSVHKADLGRDIRSLISYAVGCIFGRYSLDNYGLIYAGGEWDDSKYSTFIPDGDNILPITDEEYFEDDIVGLFCKFVKVTFGEVALEENLDFIANALGNKGSTSREIIRTYFVKDFFRDHCKVYQKRPIYWLFDSGKADGFKALVYTHRYDENTIGNLRIDYLHRMQRVYDREIIRMQETIDNSTNAREVTSAEKRKEKLTKQLKETKDYDEKIAHLALARISIDLDDGVKVNYEKVQTGADGKKLEVLAEI